LSLRGRIRAKIPAIAEITKKNERSKPRRGPSSWSSKNSIDWVRVTPRRGTERIEPNLLMRKTIVPHMREGRKAKKKKKESQKKLDSETTSPREGKAAKPTHAAKKPTRGFSEGLLKKRKGRDRYDTFDENKTNPKKTITGCKKRVASAEVRVPGLEKRNEESRASR